MKEIPVGFVKRIEELLAEYAVDNLNKADVMGQATALLKGRCAGVDYDWMQGGYVYAHVVNSHAVDTLIKLVDVLTAKAEKSHVKYCDNDLDLTGVKFVDPIECLTCNCIVARLDQTNPAPETKDCPRCKGTGKDPEFFETSWVVLYQNHGNTKLFAIHEDCGRIQLHIRRLDYNPSDAKVKAAFKGICGAIRKEDKENPSPLLRYRDTRDDGFVLSLSWDKPKDREVYKTVAPDDSFFDINHHCETSKWAIHAVEDIVEHFVCVIDSLEKGEEP